MIEWVYGNIAGSGITYADAAAVTSKTATGSVDDSTDWKTAANTKLFRFDQREFVANDAEW